MKLLQSMGLTHPGTVKDINEDAILAEDPVFVVADGIGGSDHGEFASQTVVELFGELARRGAPSTDDVVECLQLAHERVRRMQQERNCNAATTACGAVAVRMGQAAYWVIFNIGDSRVYRMQGRSGRLEQVSVDHSHVQELVEAGLLDEADAETHPNRNVVTRAVGADDQFLPDYWLAPVVAGDRLMICSDGLLRDSEETQVHDIVCRRGDGPDVIAHELMNLALESGARDNVSVIIVDVADDDDAEVGNTEASNDLTTMPGSKR